ncbi:hypothetical protein [Streptomyces sp. NPDC003832]
MSGGASDRRTAGIAAAGFLPVNGVDPVGCDQDTAYGLVIDVAGGAESAIPEIAERLREL